MSRNCKVCTHEIRTKTFVSYYRRYGFCDVHLPKELHCHALGCKLPIASKTVYCSRHGTKEALKQKEAERKNYRLF
jgi:hypothetical protein